MIKNPIQNKALRTARIGVFAALYAATSLIPISMFIGAPSFLALNLIITPAIALLLPPAEALLTAFIGSLIGIWIAPYQAIFGPFTILLPTVGATVGSLAYHKTKLGSPIAAIFLIATMTAFVMKIVEFPYWIIPHAFALILVLIALFKLTPRKIRVPIYTFIATICEQATMMMFAVYLLLLPWIVFATAFPLMIYERIVGTVGGALLVYGVRKAAPKYFPTLEK